MTPALNFRVAGVCNAYESGFGHHDRDLPNPYSEGSDEYLAYAYGKEVGAERAQYDNSGATGWQPVETAPKDGSPILIAWEGKETIVAVKYNKAFRKFNWLSLCGNYRHSSPTHWAPLLMPPNANNQRQAGRVAG